MGRELLIDLILVLFVILIIVAFYIYLLRGIFKSFTKEQKEQFLKNMNKDIL